MEDEGRLSYIDKLIWTGFVPAPVLCSESAYQAAMVPSNTSFEEIFVEQYKQVCDNLNRRYDEFCKESGFIRTKESDAALSNYFRTHYSDGSIIGG